MLNVVANCNFDFNNSFSYDCSFLISNDCSNCVNSVIDYYS